VDNNYLDLGMNKSGFVHTLPSARLKFSHTRSSPAPPQRLKSRPDPRCPHAPPRSSLASALRPPSPLAPPRRRCGTVATCASLALLLRPLAARASPAPPPPRSRRSYCARSQAGSRSSAWPLPPPLPPSTTSPSRYANGSVSQSPLVEYQYTLSF
jgi:hypothetical protein